MSTRLFVCLSACISQKPHDQPSPNFHGLILVLQGRLRDKPIKMKFGREEQPIGLCAVLRYKFSLNGEWAWIGGGAGATGP